MKKIILAAALVFNSSLFTVSAQDKLANMVGLPGNQTVITEEGSFEPNANGSYSIRLYDADRSNPEINIFRSGIIRPRIGTLDKVKVTNINADEQLEIIVMMRNVETEDSQSVDVFTFDNSELKLLNSFSNIAADIDPIEHIKENN